MPFNISEFMERYELEFRSSEDGVWLQEIDDPSVGIFSGPLSPLFKTEKELFTWMDENINELTFYLSSHYIHPDVDGLFEKIEEWWREFSSDWK